MIDLYDDEFMMSERKRSSITPSEYEIIENSVTTEKVDRAAFREYD